MPFLNLRPTEPDSCSWGQKDCKFRCAGAESGNCIAVGWVGDAAKQAPPPGAPLFVGDGEFEGGFSAAVAEDRGRGEEAAAQGAEFGAVGLAESALKADAKVVGRNGQMAGRLRRQTSNGTTPAGRFVRRAWNLKPGTASSCLPPAFGRSAICWRRTIRRAPAWATSCTATPVRRQPLVGEADPHRLHPVFGAQI